MWDEFEGSSGGRALIAIDGELESRNWPEYDRVYRDSFMHRLVWFWQTGGAKYGATYVKGPTGVHRSTAMLAERTLPRALTAVRQQGVTGLVLAGYGCGGAAAIVLGQLLAKHDVPVLCLALFDAVDLGGTVGRGISANVMLTVHGHRSPDADSRPRWGNCGLSSPNRFHQLSLKITHWGASGVPPDSACPSGKVHELVQVQNGEKVRATNVTYQEDVAAAKRLWAWVKMHIDGGPKLPAPVTERFYSVRPGDSLSLIAGRNWGEVLWWPILYDVNKDVVGSNPNNLRIGLPLIIPKISRFSPAELEEARVRGRNW